MGYVKSFTSFTNSNRLVSEETDVMLTDKTLMDLSTKIQQYKNQINQWERDIELRKKTLADEAVKNAATQQAKAAEQAAAVAQTPTPPAT